LPSASKSNFFKRGVPQLGGAAQLVTQWSRHQIDTVWAGGLHVYAKLKCCFCSIAAYWMRERRATTR
jgi:hypothetical protein